jgi:hypothetical protein
VEKDMVERFSALLRRRDRHLQVLTHAVLTDVVVERPRTESRFILRVFVDAGRGDDAIIHAVEA